MTTNEQIALIGLLFVAGGSIASIVLGVRKIKEDLTAEIAKAEIVWERRLGQVDGGLRVVIKDVELYVRDNYVNNEVFTRMIDLAAASNENQFRAITEQLNRLNDKLDTIQAAQMRLVSSQ